MIKNFISTLLARFQSEDEEGQTLVEYGLLLALIAIIVIVALIFLGPIIGHVQQRRQRAYTSCRHPAPRQLCGAPVVPSRGGHDLCPSQGQRREYHRRVAHKSSRWRLPGVRRLLTAVTTLRITATSSVLIHPSSKGNLREAIESPRHPGRRTAGRPRLRGDRHPAQPATRLPAGPEEVLDDRPRRDRGHRTSATRSLRTGRGAGGRRRRPSSGTPLASTSAVSGQPALFAIPEGSQVTAEVIGLGGDTPWTSPRSLNPGEKAIAFQVDRVTGLDFLVKAGDHIDIVLSQQTQRPPGDRRLGATLMRTPAAVRERHRPRGPAHGQGRPAEQARPLRQRHARPVPDPVDADGDGVADPEQPAQPVIDSVIIVFAGTDQDAELIKFAQNALGEVGIADGRRAPRRRRRARDTPRHHDRPAGVRVRAATSGHRPAAQRGGRAVRWRSATDPRSRA